MAWRRPGDKPLSEPMMVSLLTQICVTLSQWFKCIMCGKMLLKRRVSNIQSQQNMHMYFFLFAVVELHIYTNVCSDLSHYLHQEFAVVVDNNIIAHMLWADDLVLFSDTPKGLQRQLDGLKAFCATNHMIVNGMKTKFMCFGKKSDCKLFFDNQEITQAEQYKYVGNIIKPVHASHGNIFGDNYNFLCDKAQKAIFAMKKRLKATGHLPPSVMFFMFNTLIQPILLYGSEIWGVRKTGCAAIDKVFFSFMKHTLYVKQSTSNIITIGECGQIPPSVVCHTNVINYMHRIKDMNDHHIVKQVYNELSRLHELGFTTWCSRVWKLVQQYNIDIFHNDGNFKTYCQSSIENKFIQNWEFDVQNVEKNPILRTYAKIKTTFGIEKYVDSVRNFRYRNAITKIRTSSHSLEIEKGRHRKIGNKIPACQRLCQNYNVVEDEIHFVMDCTINLSERRTLFNNITADSSPFENLDRMSKFKYLFSTENAQHLTWLGNFLYTCFSKRIN